ERLLDRLAQSPTNRRFGGLAFRRALLADRLEYSRGRGHTDVCAEQRLLERREDRLALAIAAEDFREPATEALAGLRQRRAKTPRHRSDGYLGRLLDRRRRAVATEDEDQDSHEHCDEKRRDRRDRRRRTQPRLHAERP